MTTVEAQRIPLKDEDRATISTQMSALNALKTQYGQHHLNFDAIRAQFEELSKQHKAEASRIRDQIASKHLEVQNTSQRFISSYNIDPIEGGWSLNVDSGSFIRVAPAPEPVVSETPRAAEVEPISRALRKAAKKHRHR